MEIAGAAADDAVGEETCMAVLVRAALLMWRNGGLSGLRRRGSVKPPTLDLSAAAETGPTWQMSRAPSSLGK